MMTRGVSQSRWVCSRCKAVGWWTPSTHIGKPPLVEHDRSNGRACKPPKGVRPGRTSVSMSIHPGRRSKTDGSSASVYLDKCSVADLLRAITAIMEG